MKFEGFIGASYEARSKTLDSQRCINLFPEVDKTGKNVMALFPTPGCELFSTAGVGLIRGVIEIETKSYVVSGTTLYLVTIGGTATSIGTIAGTEYVEMAYNGTQVFIAAGLYGYIITTATDTLAQITDPDFPGADMVDYSDGYFIFAPPTSQRFYLTAINDGSSVDALDFSSATGAQDVNKKILVINRELWIFGSRSIEVFWNSGNADFPYERISGGFIELGLHARRSAAKMGMAAFWLGADSTGKGMVFRSNGYSPQRISTHAIEWAISQYDSSDAIGYCYAQSGHSFYVLNFPTGNETWVYDMATGLWHQRTYRNPVTAIEGRHLGAFHMFFADKNIIADYANGNLYSLEAEVYTDNGNPIIRTRSSPHIYKERNKITYSKFRVEFEPGVGLATGQGVNPQAMMRYSDDGGFTWSTPRSCSIGAIGEYSKVAEWKRLKMGRDRVFEVTISDPVKTVMVDASVDFEVHSA